jgi:transcriptional regulator with XRE-family HTH domain
MSPVKRRLPTTDQRVGENLRRLRLASDLGQADLAGLLQEWWNLGGLGKWSRGTVASVEAGTRSVTIDELMALAGFFEVGIIEFFQHRDDGTVHELDRKAILTPPLADRRDAEATYRRMRENADAHLFAAHIQHNPTNDIARRLEVKPAVLDRAGKKLWGRTVNEEYAHRVIERLEEGMPRRSMSIVRGHVVRGLQKELSAQLSERKG